jgi:hypothetical protein
MNGPRLVETEEEAKKLWKREEPRLREAFDGELLERKRFEDVVKILRTELYAETIKAYTVNKNTGELREVPQEIWGKEDITKVFEMGNVPIKWSVPNIIQYPQVTPYIIGKIEGSLLIKGDVVLSVIKPSEKIPNSTIAAQTNCYEKLLNLMQSGAQTKPKPEYLKEMQDLFHVSERSFNVVWAQAKNVSRNAQWGKKGRPNKPRA